MKTNNRILILLLPAASLLLTGGLSAQQPDRRSGPPSPSQMLERFDANGDGALEREELETAFRTGRERFEERRSERSGSPDARRADRPGKASDRTGRLGKGRCPCGERPMRGRNSGPEERNQRGRSDEAQKRRGPDGSEDRQSPTGRRSEFLVERFDANGDGSLSPNEVEDLIVMLRQNQASRSGQGPRN